MITYEEKIQKIKQNRSNALNSKVGLEKTESDSYNENDFNMSYLFGDTYSGVNDIIKLYWDEINLENGATFSSPSLNNYTKSNWETIFSDALTYNLSPAIYIFDANHNWGQDFQTGTAWFDTNGLSNGTSGVIGDLNNIISAIGVAATSLGPYTSDASYTTEAEAHDAGVAKAKTIEYWGSALRGKRTTDIIDPDNDPNGEITTDADSVSGLYSYTIGDGSIENPSYYADPEKTNLLTAITNTINAINSTSAYQAKLLTIYNELDKLFNSTNPDYNSKLVQTGITNDITDDRATITTLINSLNSYVGTNTDTASNNTLWGYYNYYNSAVGNESDFDTNLTNLSTLLGNINTTISNRYNDIPYTILGADENDKIKKHRLFWSKTIIKKPNGSLSIIKSVEDGSNAKNNVLKQVNSADEELEVLFNNTNEWIATPALYATYYNPLVNSSTNEIIQKRVFGVYSGQLHAEGYNIYRKLESEVNINNDNWSDGQILTITDKDDNGFVITNFTDTTIEEGNSYVYRMSTYDTINDSNYSSASLQSKIYDDDNPFNITGEITIDGDYLKINLGVEHKFKRNGYCVLIDDTDNTKTGFYLIVANDEMNIWLENKFDITDTINIYYTNCFVSI